MIQIQTPAPPWTCPVLVGTLSVVRKETPYAIFWATSDLIRPRLKRQIVELVRAGRSPSELAKEPFESNRPDDPKLDTSG